MLTPSYTLNDAKVMVAGKSFSIKVLGAFDLIDRTGNSVRPTGRKDCAILAILALTRNHRQTRTWLQDKLWGDRGPAQGAASLRQALSTIRAILNTDEEIIQADRTWVWLDPEKVELDHLTGDATGEILRGFDLRNEGFNDWLRESRASFEHKRTRWGLTEGLEQPDRRWYLKLIESYPVELGIGEISDLVCDKLAETLTVVGVHTTVDGRFNLDTPTPRASDFVVRVRTIQIGKTCVLSIFVTDGFGSLQWQIRREADATHWAEILHLLNETAQLFQDFAIRTEAASLRGARWSAHANGCQALMGILVPGSVSLREIAHCSEAAIAADEKGIYHALLGFSHLLIHGERDSIASLDADELMESFRRALGLTPENGLVQALAGHSYGFILQKLDRNIDMTREAVRLLPGSGICWNFYAISLAYSERYSEAVEAATRAVALCRGTIAKPMAQSTELFARLMAGDISGAISAGEASLEALAFRPSVVDLMTAYSLNSQIFEGRRKLEMLRKREPNLSIELLSSPDYPIVNSTHRTAIVDAASQLGLT